MIIHESFPCGYQIRIKVSVLDYLFADGSITSSSGCPLHGKACKKISIKKKEKKGFSKDKARKFWGR